MWTSYPRLDFVRRPIVTQPFPCGKATTGSMSSAVYFASPSAYFRARLASAQNRDRNASFRILDKILCMDALTFIEKPPDAKKLAPVYVLHGDEDFLKRQVLSVLRKVVFGSEENEFGFSTQPGEQAEFAAVRSGLETVPFLSPRRLVVIAGADPLASKYRSCLGKNVAQPADTR